ncbi:MAG: hypothetical protein P8J01_04840 [Acidimicrobiales bacterium]|nr:hypothetical protein [Acidimicrobiales bacterium]
MVFQPSQLSELSKEILELLPLDIRDKIFSGEIKKLPDNVVDAIPVSVSEQIPPSLIEAVNANPTLTLILVIAGTFGVIGFAYGVMKSGFKSAFFFGAIAIAAWTYFALS